MKLDNNTQKVNKTRLIITIIIILAFLGLMIGLYFGLGLNDFFKDEEGLRERIDSYGNIAEIIYILINFLLTTIIPITNVFTILAGVALFDPFKAATLATIGVLSGSIVSFFVARIFGRKVVNWIAGEENVEKYLKMSKGRENLVIFLILLLPGFPDDIICMIAGLTSMKWKFFLITILITRTIPTYMTAYLGKVFELNTLEGILSIIGLYALVFVLGVLIVKKWDNIMAFFTNKRKKNNEDM